MFDALTSLADLQLHSNELTTLPDDVFEPLTLLTNRLYLHDNPGAPFAPVAVALPDDGTVSSAGGTVRLNGSGSGGAWGGYVTYSWALTDPTSGVTVTFDAAASATPVVTVPPLAAGTELTFTLTVAGRSGSDGVTRGTDTATVTATHAPSPPSPPPPPPGGGRGGGPACAEDVHGNSAAQATDIALDTMISGALCPAADRDYFTVTAPGRGLVFVDTTGGVNLRGTISQNERVLVTGSTGSRQAARLGARVQAGTVVVAVQRQGGATGAYELVITFVPGSLENPGPDSFQSGIGVISGWVCEAEAVEIELNGALQMAAYGTARADTEAVCGDTDNGFGLLFNWNLLGDGEHEVVAFVDGVELGRATVTVTTLGAEFLREVTGTCEVEDFPMLGETGTVEWQQTQQNFVLAEGSAPAGANRTGTVGVGYLENPGPNSFQSGIGVISGWVCEGDEVELAIGDAGRQLAAYGTERADTLDACGDTDNGFGLLFNWNLLGEGEHEVVAWVDGEELAGRRCG